jgi:hypothetical protein
LRIPLVRYVKEALTNSSFFKWFRAQRAFTPTRLARLLGIFGHS